MDYRVCGHATREMQILEAGDGDPDLGRLRLAEKELEALEKGTTAPSPVELAKAVFAVGEAHEGRGSPALAVPFFERALGSREFRESTTWEHACHGHALRALGRGDGSRAERLARESVQFARRADPPCESTLAMALATHAEASAAIGAHSDALELASEGLGRLERGPKKALPGLELEFLLHTSKALSGLGRFDEAIGVLGHVEKLAKEPRWSTMRIHLDVLMASAAIRRRAGREQEAIARARLADAWWAFHTTRRGASIDLMAEGALARAEIAAEWGLPFRF